MRLLWHLGVELNIVYMEDKLDTEVPSPEKHPKMLFPFFSCFSLLFWPLSCSVLSFFIQSCTCLLSGKQWHEPAPFPTCYSMSCPPSANRFLEDMATGCSYHFPVCLAPRARGLGLDSPVCSLTRSLWEPASPSFLHSMVLSQVKVGHTQHWSKITGARGGLLSD